MSNVERKNLIYGLLGLFSILAVSLGYVYGHKPFTPAVLSGVFRAVWQMGVACVTLFLAAGLGERLLSKWDVSGLERLSVAAGLGLGILSLIVLFLGVTIGYSIWVNALLFLLGLFLLRRDIARWLSSLREINISDGFEKIIAVCAGILIFCAILTALAPPIRFDALVYHLVMPQLYLDAGRTYYIPEITYWGMPQLTEMNYLLALQFGGAESATLLGVLIGLVTLGGIFGVAKKYFDNNAAWMSIAALLAGGTLSGSLSWGYVDWTSMLFGAALLAALIHWSITDEKKDLFIIGALAGFALSVKYTSGVLLLTALLAALLVHKKKFSQRLTDIFIVGAMAVLVSLPWWIKNILATGNPFYPILFAAGEVDATRLFFFRSEIPWSGWGHWLAALILPLQATVYGIEGADGFSASIGPILLAFSSLAWMDWRERVSAQQKALRVSAIVLIGGMILWAVGSRFSGLLIQTRLFYAIFPAWAILAGAGFSAIWKRSFASIRFGRIAGALALFMLGLNVFQSLTAFIAANPAAVIFQSMSAKNYLARNLGVYVNAMDAVNALPENSRVVMLWEARGYYCIPRCDSDEVIDRWVSDLRREGDPRAVLQSWKEKGYTHILIHEQGAEFIQKNDARIHVEEWLALDLLRAYAREKQRIGVFYTLYEIP